MKLLIYNPTTMSVIEIYENVDGVSFVSDTLSFQVNGTPHEFQGLKMKYCTVDDTVVVSVGGILDQSTPLPTAREDKINELVNSYKTDLTSPVTTSLLWTDGKYVVFEYSDKDQLNYSKRANTLSLDTTITTFDIGSASHGKITMTKDQFIQVMGDFDNHEMTLYDKLVNLRTQVNNATTPTEIDSVVW